MWDLCEQDDTGADILRVIRFPLAIIIPPTAPYSLINLSPMLILDIDIRKQHKERTTESVGSGSVLGAKGGCFVLRQVVITTVSCVTATVNRIT
jgi:hypothetical protein